MQQYILILNFLFLIVKYVLYSVDFSKETIYALRFMNVVMLQNNHRQGSATHVAVFRVTTTRIKKKRI